MYIYYLHTWKDFHPKWNRGRGWRLSHTLLQETKLRHWFSHKCLLYIRQKPVSWSGETHQVSFPILRPKNSLSECQLDTPSFHSLSINRASPNTQLTSWIASPLLCLDKHNFWLSELASAYLLYLDRHYTCTHLYCQNKIIYLYKCACVHIHT